MSSDSVSRRSSRWCATVAIAGALAAATARPAAAIDFAFDYSVEEPGQGFNDPAQGAKRRAALEFAADIIGRLLQPSYVGIGGPGETIVVQASFETYAPGASTLASARPAFYYSEFETADPRYIEDVNYPKALANHLARADLAPTRPELLVFVNEAKPFYFETDGMAPATQTDFVSVALHEIVHGLGFTSSYRSDGDFGVKGDGSYNEAGLGNLPKPYDKFVTLGPNGPALTEISDSLRETAVTSNNLYWNGAAGIQGNMGAPPQLYAAGPFDGTASIGHLEPSQHSGLLMTPTIAPGVVQQSLSALERGMLRDMGWDITVTSQNVSWIAPGPNNQATTNSNWTSAPMPGDSLAFGSGSPVQNVDMDLAIGTVNDIRFASGAPSYTLTFKPWTDMAIAGAGVINSSTQAHSIILETRDTSAGSTETVADAARLVFQSSASAGNSNVGYQLRGGETGIKSTPSGPIYDRTDGAEIRFEGFTSFPFQTNAGQAMFNVEGGAGNGGRPATVEFRGTSSAARATINAFGGRPGPSLPIPEIKAGFGAEITFRNTSTADMSTINNFGTTGAREGAGALTTFADSSTAGDATISNFGSTFATLSQGGTTEFGDAANAGTAEIHNRGGFGLLAQGHTTFFDDSSAQNAEIVNHAGTDAFYRGGYTAFRERSTAGDATITNFGNTLGGSTGPGVVQFYDNSTAGTSEIRLGEGAFGGQAEFYGSSSAGDADLTIQARVTAGLGGGDIFFNDSSTAGTANIVVQSPVFSSDVQFEGTATAGDADITMLDNANASVRFHGSSRAGTSNIAVGRATNVQFIQRTRGETTTIIVQPGGFIAMAGEINAGDNPTTSLENATIQLLGTHGGNPGDFGGSLDVGQWATAGAATITAEGATTPTFRPTTVTFATGGRAGTSTITLNGGAAPGMAGAELHFRNGGDGDAARIIANAGSTMFARNFATMPTTVGSIEGAGTFAIGAGTLVTGGNNRSTTVTGQIIDGASLNGPDGKLVKVGTGTLTLAGANTYTGQTTINAGALTVQGSIVGNVAVNSGATLRGSGNVGGTVTAAAGAIVEPGASPGTLTVGGLSLAPGSILNMELGPTAQDKLVVNGAVSLGGTLNIALLDAFTPTVGQTFPLLSGAITSLTGAFDAINLPNFAGHNTFQLAYSGSSVQLGAIQGADFNNDGAVNGLDLARWKTAFGLTGAATHAQGDADGDLDVDGADLLVWQRQAGTPAATVAAVAVPEPPALALAAIALAGRLHRSRRTRHASFD